MNRTIYVDLTTAFEEVGRHAHGTTRVERSLVAALARMNRPDLVFCRYRPLTGSFVPVSAAEALRITTTPARFAPRRGVRASWRSHRLLRAGQRWEAWFRHRVRDRIRRALIVRFGHAGVEGGSALRSQEGSPATPDIGFAAGSVLLIAGEAHRHDFPVLMQMKRRYGLALAFVYYDLLRVLPKDDPRLRDACATDLPVTDFIVREAAVLLSISRYSADVLADNLAKRALASPPVAVIRLGTDLQEGNEHVPVPGLSPGAFVLAVGEVSARKNVALLVAVWRDLVRRKADRGIKLVVAGIVHTAGTPLVREVAGDPELAGAVCFLPNAGDGELRWLYANCRFTAFPSRLEGFGLPVAESLAFGKVCVASNAAAVPEASQGAGIHLGPDDTQAWTQTLERLIGDDEALRRAEQAIAERYVAVSWKDTAEDVLAAIEAVVPKASPMEVAPR